MRIFLESNDNILTWRLIFFELPPTRYCILGIVRYCRQGQRNNPTTIILGKCQVSDNRKMKAERLFVFDLAFDSGIRIAG